MPLVVVDFGYPYFLCYEVFFDHRNQIFPAVVCKCFLEAREICFGDVPSGVAPARFPSRSVGVGCDPSDRVAGPCPGDCIGSGTGCFARKVAVFVIGIPFAFPVACFSTDKLPLFIVDSGEDLHAVRKDSRTVSFFIVYPICPDPVPVAILRRFIQIVPHPRFGRTVAVSGRSAVPPIIVCIGSCVPVYRPGIEPVSHRIVQKGFNRSVGMFFPDRTVGIVIPESGCQAGVICMHGQFLLRVIIEFFGGSFLVGGFCSQLRSVRSGIAVFQPDETVVALDDFSQQSALVFIVDGVSIRVGCSGQQPVRIGIPDGQSFRTRYLSDQSVFMQKRIFALSVLNPGYPPGSRVPEDFSPVSVPVFNRCQKPISGKVFVCSVFCMQHKSCRAPGSLSIPAFQTQIRGGAGFGRNPDAV